MLCLIIKFKLFKFSIVIVEPHLRDITKPEDLFAKLKINDDYKLINNNLFDFLTPKIVNVDTSSTQTDHNNGSILL